MDGQITNNDIYKLMQELVKKTNDIETQNCRLQEDLKEEIRNGKTEILEELSKVKEENQKLKEENKNLRERINYIERKSKKYNLIVYGLSESDSDLGDIQKLLDLVNNTIKLDCRFTDVRDIYRIGKKQENKTRPLFVEFLNYSLKSGILQKSSFLKGTGIFISNDYTQEDYKKQKFLYSQLKIAKENNLEAKIKNNRLHIGDEIYTYEELRQKIGEIEIETDLPDTTPENEQRETNYNTKTTQENDKNNTLHFLQRRKRKNTTSDEENPQKRQTRQGNKNNKH